MGERRARCAARAVRGWEGAQSVGAPRDPEKWALFPAAQWLLGPSKSRDREKEIEPHGLGQDWRNPGWCCVQADRPRADSGCPGGAGPLERLCTPGNSECQAGRSSWTEREPA